MSRHSGTFYDRVVLVQLQLGNRIQHDLEEVIRSKFDLDDRGCCFPLDMIMVFTNGTGPKSTDIWLKLTKN